MFRLWLPLLLALVCTGCMMPNHEAQLAANEEILKKEGIVALQLGDAAPPLSGVVDSAGQPVALNVLLDKHQRGVLLFFFPALDTPNSNANLLDWDKRRAALEAEGLGAYAVCPSDAAAAAALGGKLGLSLPLLADPTGAAARAYGCLPAQGQYPQRTTVGLGHQGAVEYFHRGSLDQAAVEKAFGLVPAKK
jgi:peroxiredoxin Q/BCP